MEDKYFEHLMKINDKVGDIGKDMANIGAMLTNLTESVQNGFKESKKSDNEIIEHQKITNGRVTILEEETSVIRWFQRNPWKFVIIFIMMAGISAAIFAVFKQHFSIEEITEILIKKGLS